MPGWAADLILIGAALLAALVAYEVIVAAFRRGLRQRSDFTRSLVVRTRAPGRFALLVAALSVGLRVAPVADELTHLLQRGLLIAFIVLVGWVSMTAIDIAAAIYLRQFRSDSDDLQARKQLTQTRILRRSANALVLLVTAGAILMSIPGVKQIGVSLLAAGGAAGIIVGLALQPVLSNLMAGVQIAFTQPIRIDDAVVVQGQFGHVEEISSTYVVIRLRDLRRLIVPLKFFLDQPIENWTRDSSALDAEISLLIDQRVPIDRLRSEIQAIAKASPHWDPRLFNVEVADVRERTMEIRVRLGARDASQANSLRGEVREKVIGWLQREFPSTLPRNGVEPPVEDAPALRR